jgi:hypothetical protein
MKKERTFITDAFLQKIGKTGSLAKAADRLKFKDWEKCKPRPQMSTWSLVCEEVVDTTYSDDEYEEILAELYRRGLTDSEIVQMREFAWRTAGYLNFEMMAWDWCSLNEKDIARSIGYLEEKGEITSSERIVMEQYLQRYIPKD